MAEEPRIQEGPGHDTWVLVAGMEDTSCPKRCALPRQQSARPPREAAAAL